MFHWTWLCAKVSRGTSCETWSIGGCGSRSIAVFHKGTLEGNMPKGFACRKTCKKSCGKASWRLHHVNKLWGILSLKSNPSHIASARCTVYEQHPAPFGRYFFPTISLFPKLKSIPWKISARLCSSMYEVCVKKHLQPQRFPTHFWCPKRLSSALAVPWSNKSPPNFFGLQLLAVFDWQSPAWKVGTLMVDGWRICIKGWPICRTSQIYWWTMGVG